MSDHKLVDLAEPIEDCRLTRYQLVRENLELRKLLIDLLGCRGMEIPMPQFVYDSLQPHVERALRLLNK